MNKEFNLEAANILKNMEEERSKLKHPFVGSEHLLLSLLKKNNKIKNVFHKHNITYEIFRGELIKIVGIPNKNVSFNLYTPLLKRVIAGAIEDAKENKEEINGVYLTISLLEENEGVAIRILLGLKVDLELLYDNLNTKVTKKISKIKFGKNLNEEIDVKEKIYGRDEEINYIFETLLRKKKNNPLLIGEAGVGKTAIVEEIARKINLGIVPKEFLNYKIISLEMSNLVAGTKYRGEFEEKLSSIIEELEKRKDIILFIDEIHTMVSAGGAEGAISAGDIFKPYLARGDVKCIGATTISEYEKYLAKDKALSRRFEKIYIKEPDKEQTINILKKVKKEYETHHNLVISNKNILDIISLTDKYILDKKNPDKALDFLDSVCTYVHLKNEYNKNVYKLEKEIKVLNENKNKAIIENDYTLALNIKNKENKIINYINKNNYKIKKIKSSDIVKVLSKKANIPLLINSEDIISKIKNNLKNIVGHKKEISKIINLIEYKLKNFDSQLSILLTGSTGIGKTEILKNILKVLSKKMNVIKLNGSDFSYDSSITKLIGVTPGYAGYSEDYILKKLKYNPYSIIYIEDYNKMSSSVKNLIELAFKEKNINDAKNETISFENVFLIATETTRNSSIGFNAANIYKNEYSNLFDEVITLKNLSFDDVLEYLNKYKINSEFINEIKYEQNGLKDINKLIKIKTI